MVTNTSLFKMIQIRRALNKSHHEHVMKPQLVEEGLNTTKGMRAREHA